ncbi:MAG: hypothetical protein G01um101419_517 [Parcubacteria group bacterium Gr01-1014_19]|nr:MAG: hypothetical protein G01um101419_517 [Parcubacteria group bacterium Gr01-1014_19]
MENVLVCGYGCHLTESLKGYLDFVSKYLLSSTTTNIVITSGGRSNLKTAPDDYECFVMRDYLLAAGVKQRICYEPTSETSIENLRLTEQLFRNTEQDSIPLVIFCDSVRKFKVAYMAKRIFKQPVRVVGYDFGRSFKERVAQYLLLAPIEIVAFYLPVLEWALSEMRHAKNKTR